MRILIVEDEPKIAGFIKKGLEEENWNTLVAYDGMTALDLLNTDTFDVIILDIMLPGIDGLSVLQNLRDQGNNTPVILLTAKDTVSDRVKGLRSGADDYLIKPFSFDELLARLEALVRRDKRSFSGTLKSADIEIDIKKHRVTRKGKKINLTPSEFRVLKLLLENYGHVLSRLAIEEEIWGLNLEKETNIVDVYINRLRKKIDVPFNSSLIHTVRGFGYKLESIDED